MFKRKTLILISRKVQDPNLVSTNVKKFCNLKLSLFSLEL